MSRDKIQLYFAFHDDIRSAEYQVISVLKGVKQ